MSDRLTVMSGIESHDDKDVPMKYSKSSMVDFDPLIPTIPSSASAKSTMMASTRWFLPNLQKIGANVARVAFCWRALVEHSILKGHFRPTTLSSAASSNISIKSGLV